MNIGPCTHPILSVPLSFMLIKADPSHEPLTLGESGKHSSGGDGERSEVKQIMYLVHVLTEYRPVAAVCLIECTYGNVS